MTKTIHAVGVIFENSHKEILVLRRQSEKVEGETWGLVGGKVDIGEDKYQAIVREAKEETGVSINMSNLVFLKTYHWKRTDGDFIFETFKYLIKDALDIDLNTQENVEFIWAVPEELYARKDLMIGLYPILKDEYNL